MEHDILGIHRDENYIVLEGWSLVSSVSFLCWQLTWLSISYPRIYFFPEEDRSQQCAITAERIHVVMDNGIVQVTLTNPDGIVTGIRYNGVDSLLEVLNKETNRGFIMLRGSSGFYPYGIYEHLNGWPDFDISETRITFKLRKDKFQYMAMADNRQRVMPFPEDRLPGRCQTLGYPEAVLLVNPKDP
ncbi:hypothetical protein JHK85_009748 [Glycine max]|nr:hypothetical protein JHK85_009748 [Glycine max]KAG5065759.1 hypothetical protein JHK86_009490 [Glycine max]